MNGCLTLRVRSVRSTLSLRERERPTAGRAEGEASLFVLPIRRLVYAFTLATFVFGAAQAMDIATSFVDVLVLDAPLGSPRRVEDGQGKGLILYNRGDEAIFAHVQAVLPNAKELRAPAQPIADLAWIEIEPANFEVPGHGEAEAQVIIHVPNDKRYAHQLYQVMIWSRSQPIQRRGLSLSAGLKSRLRFKTKKS